MRRVLVCGGRDYTDADRINRELTRLHEADPFVSLIHGDAKGADRLAADWARRNGILVEPFPITPLMWQVYKRSAGRHRNETMLKIGRPNWIVAFPGGNGTHHMIYLGIMKLGPDRVIEIPA